MIHDTALIFIGVRILGLTYTLKVKDINPHIYIFGSSCDMPKILLFHLLLFTVAVMVKY